MTMIRDVIRHNQGNQEHQAHQGSDCYQGNQEHQAHQGSDRRRNIEGL